MFRPSILVHNTETAGKMLTLQSQIDGGDDCSFLDFYYGGGQLFNTLPVKTF